MTLREQAQSVCDACIRKSPPASHEQHTCAAVESLLKSVLDDERITCSIIAEDAPRCSNRLHDHDYDSGERVACGIATAISARRGGDP